MSTAISTQDHLFNKFFRACISTFWEPKGQLTAAISMIISSLLPQMQFLTPAMMDDLQQIYSKYIPQEHWLEILPKQTIAPPFYHDGDGDVDILMVPDPPLWGLTTICAYGRRIFA